MLISTLTRRRRIRPAVKKNIKIEQLLINRNIEKKKLKLRTCAVADEELR